MTRAVLVDGLAHGFAIGALALLFAALLGSATWLGYFLYRLIGP